jgi:glycosyltransferase involved in cell wall biosynthesis
MKEVVARSGASVPTLHVIHNWSDVDSIRPVAADENPLRHAWGLDRAFVACYSGNLGRAHEFETILGAAGRLVARERTSEATREQTPGERTGESPRRPGANADAAMPPIRFVFIGGGPQRRTVQDAVAARGLANVSFQPYQARADLSQSLSAGDVHLVSLRPELEGYIVPSKLYGILAAGRPTLFIGDPAGEIARIVDTERIGYVVDQGDAAGLADRLLQLARDEPLREEMGARARALLRERFDQRIALETWRKLLESVQRRAVTSGVGADRIAGPAG